MRYDLTDFEWSVIEPLLPTNRPGSKRVDDRRVLNGIFWVLRWTATGLTRQSTTATTDGARRASEIGLWTRLQRLTMETSK